MTVITKAITEKRADKIEQLLFVNENATDNTKRDTEAQCPESGVRGHYFGTRRSIYPIHILAKFLLFLVAFLILTIGVIGGLYTYRQYARAQMHRFRTGWYSILYDYSNKAPYTSNGSQQALSDPDWFRSSKNDLKQETMNIEKMMKVKLNAIGSFFKERFEMDLENEHYEKIDVPDFRGGRQGRFIHDFTTNKTGIIDIDGQCCFVMPLNRQRVLPPRNMYDLLRKMYHGYYDVDTEIVRETMKVVTPPITDSSVVGTYIARECHDLPTYMLTKVNSSVVKRSISNGLFGEFAGKNIIEFDILNLEVLKEYEKSSKKD